VHDEYGGDIVVEHVDLDDPTFAKRGLARGDSQASLCDLLRSGQANQAPSFTKQVTKKKGKELSARTTTGSASFLLGASRNNERARSPLGFITDLLAPRRRDGLSPFSAGGGQDGTVSARASPARQWPAPVKISQVNLKLETGHFSEPRNNRVLTEKYRDNVELKKDLSNTQSQLFKKHTPARNINMNSKN